MSTNFNIIEQKTINYDDLKKDYCNGLRFNELKKKYGVGNSQYQRLLNRFREEGITITGSWKKPKKYYNPEYIYRVLTKGICYWTVKRTINGKQISFGTYKNRALAEQRVKELNENNWEGLL